MNISNAHFFVCCFELFLCYFELTLWPRLVLNPWSSCLSFHSRYTLLHRTYAALKKDFIFYLIMCICVMDIFMCVKCRGGQRGSGFLGTRVRGGCDLPDMGVWSWTLDLWKNSMAFNYWAISPVFKNLKIVFRDGRTHDSIFSSWSCTKPNQTKPQKNPIKMPEHIML